MEGNTSIKSLKARYEEAIKRGERLDRKHKSLPSLIRDSSSPDTGNDGVFLTQKASIRNRAKKEIHDLEHLLSSATQTSQSTLLLKKRKEVKEVDDALELMKKDHKRRMDACEERRIQFELKQAKLREQVLKFEKFIQENDSKRQRAEMKAKYERKQYEEKCKEIALLTATIQELETSSQSLHKELIRRKRYEEYLERIVEQGDYGYEEVADILNRYKTLVGANEDLMIQSMEREKDLDSLRLRLNGLKIEKQNQLLVSNSSIQAYQNKLETIRSTVKEEEEEKFYMEDKQKDISKELCQVMLAIKNLYNRCISSMSTTKSMLTNSSSSSSSSSSSTGGLMLSNVMGMNSNHSNLYGHGHGHIHGGGNGSSNHNSIRNKAFQITTEKLDQQLVVLHARMIDFIDMLNEFPESGFTVSTTSSATTASASTAIAPSGSISSASMGLGMNSSSILLGRQMSGSNSTGLKEGSSITLHGLPPPQPQPMKHVNNR